MASSWFTPGVLSVFSATSPSEEAAGSALRPRELSSLPEALSFLESVHVEPWNQEGRRLGDLYGPG